MFKDILHKCSKLYTLANQNYTPSIKEVAFNDFLKNQKKNYDDFTSKVDQMIFMDDNPMYAYQVKSDLDKIFSRYLDKITSQEEKSIKNLRFVVKNLIKNISIIPTKLNSKLLNIKSDFPEDEFNSIKQKSWRMAITNKVIELNDEIDRLQYINNY